MISHHFVELDELGVSYIIILLLFHKIIEKYWKKLSRNKFTLNKNEKKITLFNFIKNVNFY